jgi:hypothetical protein
MSNWYTLKPDKLLPPEIRAVADTATTITSALTTYLNTLKSSLEIVQQFSDSAASNPVEPAIRGILDEIDQLITDLTSGQTVHAIMVPIQKQFFGRGVRLPAAEADASPTYQEFVEHGAFSLESSDLIPGETIQFINAAPTAVGGSQGFWKVLAQSLSDQGDSNRPDFPDDYAVGGMCLMFGAQDLASIQPNINLFSSLMNLGDRASLAAGTRPLIKNFTARATVLTADSGRIAVQLDWDPIQPVIAYPLYSDDQIAVKEILIVRSLDPHMREWFNWDQVFSVQPSDDTSDLPEAGTTKVIARVENDGFVKRYIDTDDSVKVGDIHYYTAILRYEINGETQPMGAFTNCVRVEVRPGQSRRGEPPDWFATPGLISLFPDLATLVGHARVLIASLGSRTTSNNGVSSLIGQTITQIETTIDLIQDAIDEISGVTDRLASILQSDIAATSSTVFAVSTGGIYGWLAELARRISDPNDESRPPFETGSELVAGVVIVAGAPSTAQLEAYMAMLEMFFGSSESNSLLEAIDSIEREAAPPISATFDDTMSASHAAVAESTAATPESSFDDALRPSTRVVC